MGASSSPGMARRQRLAGQSVSGKPVSGVGWVVCWPGAAGGPPKVCRPSGGPDRR